MPPLATLLGREGHVVPQVVEAEFVVSPVGDVGGIGGPFLGPVVDVGDNQADRQAEPAVDLPHPLAVPSSQVVVHCAQVHSTTSESVQIGGKCGHQGLPLAGTHLGDPSQVEGDPAHHLDVVMALAENPLCRLSDHRERLDKEVVEFLAVF